MNTLHKFLKLGAMLAASSTLAHANPLRELVMIDGGNSAITPLVPTSTSDNISILPGLEVTTDTPFADFTQPTFNRNHTPDSFAVTSITTAPSGSLIFYGSLGDNLRFPALNLTPETNSQGQFHGTPNVSSTPEPSSLFLLGTGLVGAAVLVLRKHRSSGV